MFSWANGKGWRQGQPLSSERFHGEQDFGGPFSSAIISAQWVPLVWIKHLPECHTSLATSQVQVTPFQLQPPHHCCMVGPGLWAAQTDKVVNLNALLNLLGNKEVVQATALKTLYKDITLQNGSTSTVALDQYKIQLHLIQKKHQHVVIVTTVTNAYLRSVAKMWQWWSRRL